MERAWRIAVMGLFIGCGESARYAYQVELIEDDVAQVVNLDSGKASAVKRGALPSGAREGDVVVNGRIDEQQTQALRREIEALRKRLLVPLTPLTGIEE